MLYYENVFPILSVLCTLTLSALIFLVLSFNRIVAWNYTRTVTTIIFTIITLELQSITQTYIIRSDYLHNTHLTQREIN